MYVWVCGNKLYIIRLACFFHLCQGYNNSFNLLKFIRLIEAIEALQEEDVTTNKKMAEHGAKHILQHSDNDQGVVILTHCNTGSLATAGYGTALGL